MFDITEIRNAQKEKIKREDDRLLYVALTRAEQALIIAGWEAPARRVIKNSWYELLRDTMSNDPACVDIDGILKLQFKPSTETKKKEDERRRGGQRGGDRSKRRPTKRKGRKEEEKEEKTS